MFVSPRNHSLGHWSASAWRCKQSLTCFMRWRTTTIYHGTPAPLQICLDFKHSKVQKQRCTDLLNSPCVPSTKRQHPQEHCCKPLPVRSLTCAATAVALPCEPSVLSAALKAAAAPSQSPFSIDATPTLCISAGDLPRNATWGANAGMREVSGAAAGAGAVVGRGGAGIGPGAVPAPAVAGNASRPPPKGGNGWSSTAATTTTITSSTQSTQCLS